MDQLVKVENKTKVENIPVDQVDQHSILFPAISNFPNADAFILCFTVHRLYCSLCVFTQRRSVTKNVGCFQWNLFVCLWVCGFVWWCVCQHDNFRTSNYEMMKPGSKCIVQISRPSSNFGSQSPAWVRSPQKCGVRLQRWENQHRLSSHQLCFHSFIVLSVDVIMNE